MKKQVTWTTKDGREVKITINVCHNAGIRYFHIPSLKQIETLNALVNEINDIVNEAKKSPNYNEFDHLIERALSGVMTSSDDGGSMVELARKSGDKTIYSTTIKMLFRTKKSIQNIVDYYRN